jgi:hypothetical protein
MNFFVEFSDRRNIILAEILKRRTGFNVFGFASGEQCGFCENAVVVFSPAKRLSLSETVGLPKKTVVFGGAQEEGILSELSKKDILYKNLLLDELYAVENAALTAEGALALLITHSEKSMLENKVLVLGLGRVGKAVCLLLSRCGVSVSGCTFDSNELSASPLYAKKTFQGSELSSVLNQFDVIINTVPAIILNTSEIESLSHGTLIIELASKPCLNEKDLNENGLSGNGLNKNGLNENSLSGNGLNEKINYLKAPALPSRFCAYAAAEAMINAVLRQLENNECHK